MVCIFMGTQTKFWKKYSSCEQLDMVATFASQTNTPKSAYRKSKNRINDVLLSAIFWYHGQIISTI